MKIERKLEPLPLRYEQAGVGKTPIYKEVLTYSHTTGVQFVKPDDHEDPKLWKATAPGAIADRVGWMDTLNVQHHEYSWRYAAPVVNVSKFGEFRECQKCHEGNSPLQSTCCACDSAAHW